MFNQATNLYLAVAAFAGATSVAYWLAVEERAGFALLLLTSVAALVAAFAGLAAGVDDRGLVSDDAEAGAADDAVLSLPAGAARPVGSSPWPLAIALAAALAVVGTAVGVPVLVAAVVAALFPLFGWIGQVWREHPGFTPRAARRVDDRLVSPVLVPVGTFAVVLLIGVAVSRVFLAVNKDAAAFIGIVVAVLILAALYLVAARPNMSSSGVVALSTLGVVALLAGGVAGAVSGEREFHHAGEGHGEEATEVHFVAENLEFVEPGGKIEVEAGSKLHWIFDNHDEDYHNVAVYERESGPDGSVVQGAPIFNGKPIPEGEIEYELEAPKRAGTYLYICDFHINMKGDLVVR